MLINFNVEKLDELLINFYNLTGLTISVWDADYNQLSYQPKNMQSFCRVIKSTKEGKRRCLECDIKLCAECSRTGLPATHVCHAGLIDTAIPIKYKEHTLGYVMFGQTTDRREDNSRLLEAISESYGIDCALMKSLYSELPTYDAEKIRSASVILKTCTRYLWLSEYIEIGYNSDGARLDNYIRRNLSDNLTIDALVDTLKIPKNKLYKISHECFGRSVSEYISELRIEEAKRLPATTDLSISDIAQTVGIADYNYFIKVFRSIVGTTPLKFRKEFPFNLHKD